jgi:hypothetical protein
MVRALRDREIQGGPAAIPALTADPANCKASALPQAISSVSRSGKPGTPPRHVCRDNADAPVPNESRLALFPHGHQATCASVNLAPVKTADVEDAAPFLSGRGPGTTTAPVFQIRPTQRAAILQAGSRPLPR